MNPAGRTRVTLNRIQGSPLHLDEIKADLAAEAGSPAESLHPVQSSRMLQMLKVHTCSRPAGPVSAAICRMCNYFTLMHNTVSAYGLTCDILLRYPWRSG
ncbi:hypothetical protein D3C73_1190230 [compost metagenome]